MTVQEQGEILIMLGVVGLFVALMGLFIYLSTRGRQR